MPGVLECRSARRARIGYCWDPMSSFATRPTTWKTRRRAFEQPVIRRLTILRRTTSWGLRPRNRCWRYLPRPGCGSHGQSHVRGDEGPLIGQFGNLLIGRTVAVRTLGFDPDQNRTIARLRSLHGGG